MEEWLAESNEHLGATVALLVLFAAGALGVLWRRRKEGTARFLDAADPSVTLQPGLVLVRGVVTPAGDEPLRLRLVVEQQGEQRRQRVRNTSKTRPVHEWLETGRRNEGSPFYLVRDEGTRVRVEPSEAVLVLDDPHPTERLARDRRCCVAAIAGGTTATVYGALHRGPDPDAEPVGGAYRDGAREGWVLRPPPNGAVLVTSDPEALLLRAIAHPRDGGRVAQGLLLALGALAGLGAVANHSMPGMGLSGALLLGVLLLLVRSGRVEPYSPPRLEHRHSGPLR